MNNKVRCLLLTLLIVSCKKGGDNNSTDDCILISQNEDWTNTEFRSNYTIQFPNNYSVTIQQGYEGMVYDVTRDDNSVHFHYIYCNSMECYGFEGLPGSLPDFVDTDASGGSIRLDQKAIFCNGNALTGVFYYNNDNNSPARLYWKDNGAYRQALEVSYKRSRHQEVIEIIKTIKRK
jgi:hypothetical protein